MIFRCWRFEMSYYMWEVIGDISEQTRFVQKWWIATINSNYNRVNYIILLFVEPSSNLLPAFHRMNSAFHAIGKFRDWIWMNLWIKQSEKNMKNFICILLITLHCQVFGVTVPAESFKQALQHVINSATKSKFSDIQGEKFEILKKGNNVIEKYQTIDSLPGSIQNYIQISFARSFRSVLFTSTEITD